MLISLILLLDFWVACRKSPWSSHFVISNVNKRLAGKDGYTYDLEWSPDFINPPIKQEVTMVPPTYIE